MKYSARCHCGNVRFSFVSAEIKDGVRCNCSLCIRRGAVMSSMYVPAAQFTTSPSLDQMHAYLWNDKVVAAYSCKTCAIFTHVGSDEYGYRINLGCVEGVDALNLPVRVLDGRSMPLAQEPGPHPGKI